MQPDFEMTCAFYSLNAKINRNRNTEQMEKIKYKNQILPLFHFLKWSISNLSIKSEVKLKNKKTRQYLFCVKFIDK